MKILQVIHGYPMRYNAGSEVYTQGLAQALAERHDVHVFTRQENSFLPEYATHREADPSDPRITLHVINMARARDGYRPAAVDGAFAGLLDEVHPEVVHIGHLNHLSTALVFAAKERWIPVAFTLHDYWLMCPRGQFIQMYPQDPSDVWARLRRARRPKVRRALLCCATSQADERGMRDGRRLLDGSGLAGAWSMSVEVCDAVDMFIAPSRYLLQAVQGRLRNPCAEAHLSRLRLSSTAHGGPNSDCSGEPFTFGYIGTHIPAKGVNHLIESFGSRARQLPGCVSGVDDRGVETEGLQGAMAKKPA